MRKLLIIILTLALLMLCTTVFGEGVIILESPDKPKSNNLGSLEDLKVGVGVDLGDRIYTPVKIEICDRFSIDASYNNLESGAENQYVCLWLEALNLATKDMDFFNDATVVVAYDGERGTYKFGGFARQCFGDKPFWAGMEQEHFQSIGPLLKRNYLFYCLVPNFVEENPGEIRMEIATGGETMICVIRK